MASTKQVTLARASRPSVHAAPVTRIPAFLNKLYEMVNDDKTNHLIEWSASGDTFYVYDQERFSRDVLPHWFKHQNFASFVRQLNMYGFHKIPHLQQGVLKSEVESEHWNFVHDDFRRDQPGRLRRIQRKKAGNTVEDDSKLESASAALPAATNGQVLDLQSVVNGIAAIKRHQTTISAELSELKHNNELLWQESEAARARHQKQQDTINRIVKFLAGVFGHPASSPKEDVRVSSPSRVAVPRRQARLMIENNPKRVDEPATPAAFASIDTPISMASPMESGSPKATPSLHSPTPSHSNLPLDEANNVVSTQPQYPQTSATEAYSVTPSRSPTNSDFDSLIQGALSSLTPAQIQQLMNSISMTSYPDFPASGPEQDTALMSYQPSLDFSQLTSLPLISSPSPPSTNLTEEVDKSWTDMEEIEQDVDAVDTKINNLCQQFHIPNDTSSASLGSIGLGDEPPSIPNPSDNDLFHSFLNGLGDESTIVDADNTTSTAFLDEIPTAPASDGTLSPFSILQEQSTPITPKQAKKRKSTAKDPASTDDAELSLGTRAKRRKDR